MAKKSVLGKGLSAILNDVEEAYKQDIDQHSSSELIKEVELDKIRPNPYQPRKSFDEEALSNLSASIKQHGLLQPIVVVQKDDGYMLIAGERRVRASKLAGLETIKAIVTDFESENLRELALIENIQREDLNPIELANSYAKLIEEYGITQDELSEIIHKSRTQITNTMRLLRLSQYTKELIVNSKISQGHAKVLVGLDEKKERLIVDTIIGQKLSVRDTEELVKSIKSGTKHTSITKKAKNVTNKDIEKIVELLKEKGIKAKTNSNNLIIDLKKSADAYRFYMLLNSIE